MLSRKITSIRFIRSYTTKVGFIGLGNMGSRMAPHLVEKGNYQLFVHDVNEAAMESIQKSHGAIPCKTISSITKQADVIITMLPAPKHVKSVYSKIWKYSRPGQLFIDASTIDPQTAIQLNEKAKNFEVKMADAPVSGGILGAAAGTLTFMVGAEDAVFEQAKEYLEHMGKKIIHCGTNGMGQTAKVCNNLVLGICMAAVSEGMLLGTELGIDPKKLADVFNTSTARCWSSDSYNPYPGVMENVPSSRDYEGGFLSKLMLKDLGLAISAGKESKTFLPLGKATMNLYKKMIREMENSGEKDFSIILKYLQSKKPQ